MDPTWTTTVLLVPFVVVLTAGFFYLYGFIVGLLSKTSVRNKVVVLTDALSGLGKGNISILCCLRRKLGTGNLKYNLSFSVFQLVSMKNAQVCFTKEERG